MNKLVMEGKVAVLYTCDFGAGWSTWNPEFPECVFDPEIAKMVCLGVSANEIKKFAEEKYGVNFYEGGADSLTVKWLPEGTKFYIAEYDGRETIVTEEKLYLTA
jgi:hypothetical protein